MYTALLTANKGGEKVASVEASELIACSKVVADETVVKFDFKNLIDLCRLTYMAQGINRAILLLSEFKADKSLEKTSANFMESVKKIDFSNWIPGSKTYKVECERNGEHDYHSVDLEIEAGKIVNDVALKNSKMKLKTEFDNPNVLLHIYIWGEKAYFGVDFSGFELSKRQYKIFNSPESLKGTTGYNLVRLAGFDKKKVMLDPFMGSGVIVIEAGLYMTGFSVQYYNKDKLFFTNMDFFKEYGPEKFFREIDSKAKDKITNIFGYDSQLRYLKATQKNAKLAGIGDNVFLSKCEIEWLDTKIDKKSVDLIITDPPRLSKNKEEKRIMKVFNELFYQADYILKPKGNITLLTKDNDALEKAALNHKFKIIEKYTLNQGKEIFNVLTFRRG